MPVYDPDDPFDEHRDAVAKAHEYMQEGVEAATRLMAAQGKMLQAAIDRLESRHRAMIRQVRADREVERKRIALFLREVKPLIGEDNDWGPDKERLQTECERLLVALEADQRVDDTPIKSPIDDDEVPF